jgi:hypothetical protein
MKNNIVTIASTSGIIYGLYYSMKNNKNLTQTALFSIGFGLVGMFIGKGIENLKK